MKPVFAPYMLEAARLNPNELNYTFIVGFVRHRHNIESALPTCNQEVVIASGPREVVVIA